MYTQGERVIIAPSDLVGTVLDFKTVDGEQAYIVQLEHPSQTEDGTYCARESELRRPQD